MKRLFLIFILLFLSATSSIAGGLFAGCYSSGFGTHSWRADTEAYIARVEADGGTVINEQLVNDAYQFLADHSLSPLVWVDANFGVKKDGSNKVSKLYDLSSGNKDAAQVTADNQPTWTASQQNGLATISFDGTNDNLQEGTQLGKPSSFTAFTVFKASIITSQTALWMNRVDGVAYPFWGAILSYNSNGDMGLLVSKESATAGVIGGRTDTGKIGTTSYYLRTDRFATGANVLYIYLSGGAAETLTYAYQMVTENSGTSFDFRIGMYGDSAVYYQGYIGSLCIFSSSLSDTDRGYVRDFINSKYAAY